MVKCMQNSNNNASLKYGSHKLFVHISDMFCFNDILAQPCDCNFV